MSNQSGQSCRFQFSKEVSLNFEIYGTGAPTLLCLHGFGASLESWRDIQPLLSASHRVVLVDLKGFGLSSKPHDGKYSAKDQAEIVTAFIEQNGFADLALVGHSYGGAVALLTYFKLLDKGLGSRVLSLVLLDSAGYVQRLPFFVLLPRIPVVNRLVLCGVPAKWQARFTLRYLFYNSSEVTTERIQRYARFLRLPGSVEAMITCARQIIFSDSEQSISRIVTMRLATLVIWGQNDPAISVDYAHQFHRDISGSELKIVSRCGHVPHEEYPVEISQMILDFLRGAGGRGIRSCNVL